MKATHYKYIIGAALGLLAACNTDDVASYTPVEDAIDGIVLRAGVREGGVGVATRAIDDRHGQHVLFTQGTKLALQLNGQWNTTVTQTTTGTTGTESATVSRHNSLTLSPALFWNDYGVADPGNIAGRTAGLTIYGAAIDGATSTPTGIKWDAPFEWKLPTDQTGGWVGEDLLTSNNIRPTTASADGTGRKGDGTYTFDDYLRKLATPTVTASDIIEFTHAMAKMTVVLTAGDGFEGGKFVEAPTVTLTSFKYEGSVDIPAKTSTPSGMPGNIQMHLVDGGAAATTATFDALVYPGNNFTDDTPLLSLTADGNTFAITAKKLNDAIRAAISDAAVDYPATGTDVSFKQGWNYMLKIRVNKTGTHVTATIVDWNEVEAEEEAPKINITTAYGEAVGTNGNVAFTENFDFFRSTTIGSSYSNDATITYNTTGGTYDFSTPLYWPNHQIHYFFRGVYPKVGDAPLTPAAKFATSTSSASTIAVSNVPYETQKYPSDLAIGYPRTTTETCPHGNTVATTGICATEGDIRMNFRYVMAQVEVELKSVTGDAAVNIDKNTKVEIVNVYNDGNVLLSDGSVTPTGTTSSYTLNNIDGAANDLKRLSAIVPQALTYTTAGATSNVRFKITVTNTDGTTDVYYADVNPILKKDSTTDKVAANGKWESGMHYKYVLTLSKTGIKVTATLKDWVNVEASENVWF